jgi:hypothetical protein
MENLNSADDIDFGGSFRKTPPHGVSNNNRKFPASIHFSEAIAMSLLELAAIIPGGTEVTFDVKAQPVVDADGVSEDMVRLVIMKPLSTYPLRAAVSETDFDMEDAEES